MAELTQKERLQPSLLDRLTDDARDQQIESRDKRVLSPARLRECVRRDLTWLLNTTHLAAVPAACATIQPSRARFSTTAVQELTGLPLSSMDTRGLERMLTQVIANYEPRLLRRSVRVRLIVDKDKMAHNAVIFEIEAELWAQPLPLRLFLRTEIDLENGTVAVAEGHG